MVAERNGRLGPLGFKLDIQAKSTTGFVRTKHEVKYDLRRKNYDDLRDTSVRTPRILVLLLLPANESDWLVTTEEALILRHCAYWLSLKGSPPTAEQRDGAYHLASVEHIHGPDAAKHDGTHREGRDP